MEMRTIDTERRCEHCGLCVKACREGAIGMVNGKASLLREDYCGCMEFAAKMALHHSGKSLSPAGDNDFRRWEDIAIIFVETGVKYDILKASSK